MHPRIKIIKTMNTTRMGLIICTVRAVIFVNSWKSFWVFIFPLCDTCTWNYICSASWLVLLRNCMKQSRNHICLWSQIHLYSAKINVIKLSQADPLKKKEWRATAAHMSYFTLPSCVINQLITQSSWENREKKVHSKHHSTCCLCIKPFEGMQTHIYFCYFP